MKYFIVLSLALTVIVLSNCTIDKPLPGAYEMLDRGKKGEIVVKTFPAVKNASYWTAPLAGGETTLMLGETNHIKSHLLLRFTSFSTLDTTQVVAAKIYLRQYSHSGDGADFQASIYKVTGPWLADVTDGSAWESGVTWESIKNNYDSGTIYGTFTGVTVDTITTVSASLDPSLVNEWIDAEKNYGILLSVDHADLMALYYSSETLASYVTLEVVQLNTDATLDTNTVNVYQDASLLEFKSPIAENELKSNNEFLRVGNGSGFRSFIQFDLSSLPVEATIHHALLTLFVNGDSSKSASATILVAASPVLKDSTWTPADLSLYSLNSSPAGYADGDDASFSFASSDAVKSIVSFTQAWIWGADAGGIANYGIALLPYNEGINTSEISFHSGQSDSTLLPTLRVTYSLPPSSRFSN